MNRLIKRAAKRCYSAVFARDFVSKVNGGFVEYPHYAYICIQAASLAKRLGHKEVTAIEFGVAGGNGLLALERHASVVGDLTGVEIKVLGFDAGQGLPSPEGYRDVPFIWQSGHFEMDVAKLKARIGSAELVLGDIRSTLQSRLEDQSLPPIGAVSFDLDYYSSTVAAFECLRTIASRRLPRIYCYMDDVISSDMGNLCEELGVPRAIAEFNEAGKGHLHLGRLNHLKYQCRGTHRWHELIYVSHDFQHPEYSTYVGDGHRVLPLSR